MAFNNRGDGLPVYKVLLQGGGDGGGSLDTNGDTSVGGGGATDGGLVAPIMTVDDFSSDSVSLSWTGIKGATDGRIYKLRYKAQPPSKWQDIVTSDTSVTVSELEPNTLYQFEVQVQIDENSSPPSIAVYQRTVDGPPTNTTQPQNEGRTNRCEAIAVALCSPALIPYNITILPNLYGHTSQDQINLEIQKWFPVAVTGCSIMIGLLVCSTYVPACTLLEVPIPPCKEVCSSVRNDCQGVMDFPWPEVLNCDSFPSQSDPQSICIGPVVEIPPGVLPPPGFVGGSGTTNNGGDQFSQFGPDGVPEHCEPLQIEMCQSPEIPYNYTQYPVPYGDRELINQESAMYESFMVEGIIESGCSPVMRFFACAALAPVCSPLPSPIPPCRELCEIPREQCRSFLESSGTIWPAQLECENFPEGPPGPTNPCIGFTSEDSRGNTTEPGSEECNAPLGIQNGDITDDQMTASSFYTDQGELNAWDGRLNNTDYWATSDEPPVEADPWIQVDLLEDHTVTGIIIQGGAHRQEEWVTELQVQYGESEDTLTFISENDEPRTFNASTDKETPVTINFPKPIVTRILRIRPTAWNDWCSLRFEILGCPPVCVGKPAGLEDGSFSDEQLKASSHYGGTDGRSPQRARINGDNFWATANLKHNFYHWLQIDFVNATKIKGIQTQGSSAADNQWVTALEIETGDDEDLLLPIQANGSVVTFKANTDSTGIVDIEFPEPLTTRILRVVPTEWERWVSMRLEVIVEVCEPVVIEAGAGEGKGEGDGKDTTVTSYKTGWPIQDRQNVDSNGWTMVSPDLQFTSEGQITEWNYWPKTTNPFIAIVWRAIEDAPGFEVIGINDIPAPENTGSLVAYTVPEDERITVQAGDMIGWSFGNGVIAWNQGGNYSVFWLPGSLWKYLDVSQTHQFSNRQSEPREYSIKAVVESLEAGESKDEVEDKDTYVSTDVSYKIGWPIEDRQNLDSNGWTMISPDLQFTLDGQVIEWRYWPKTTNPFRAIVWRPTEDGDDVVGINDIPAPDNTGSLVAYTVPEDERINVQAGDMIGWSFGNAVIAWNQGGDYRVFWIPGNLHESLDVNQTHQFSIRQTEPREYSIQAVVESLEGAEISLIGQPTDQSSVLVVDGPSINFDGAHNNAVDGNTDGDLLDGDSCTRTYSEASPWWSVDMGAGYCVTRVEIFNRINFGEELLEGAIVRIGPNSNRTNPICGTISIDQINANQMVNVTCELFGRYLSVALPEHGVLTLCEVRAFAGRCEEVRSAGCENTMEDWYCEESAAFCDDDGEIGADVRAACPKTCNACSEIEDGDKDRKPGGDSESLVFKPPVIEEGTPVCQDIVRDIKELCPGLEYNSTFFPNSLGHADQEEAFEALSLMPSVMSQDCSGWQFLCVLAFPPCKEFGDNKAVPLLPCREECTYATTACVDVDFDEVMQSLSQWTDTLDCEVFPEEYSSPPLCWEITNAFLRDAPKPDADGTGDKDRKGEGEDGDKDRKGEGETTDTGKDEDKEGVCSTDVPKVCSDIGFISTLYPNKLDHQDGSEALQAYEELQPAFDSMCSPELSAFVCAGLFPVCDSSGSVSLPCHESCRRVWKACKDTFTSLNLDRPLVLSCNKYYEPVETDPSCLSSFNMPTKAPKLKNIDRQATSAKLVLWPQDENAQYFDTKVFSPVGPAREIEKKFNVSTDTKTTTVTYEDLKPNVTYYAYIKTTNAFGDSPSILETIPKFEGVECQSLEIEMCDGLGYDMALKDGSPNSFGHIDQAEAFENLLQYNPLIQFGCSDQLKKFLCWSFVPGCSLDLNVVVPPCRESCEASRFGCETAMKAYGYEWPAILDCEQFPYSNDSICELNDSIRYTGTQGEDGSDYLCTKLFNSDPETAVKWYGPNGEEIGEDPEEAIYTEKWSDRMTRLVITENSAEVVGDYTCRFDDIEAKAQIQFHEDRCNSNDHPFCGNLYNSFKLPNHANQTDPREALLSTYVFLPLMATKCSEYINHFACYYYLPNSQCMTGEDINGTFERFEWGFGTTDYPCRELCYKVQQDCAPIMKDIGFIWPEEVSCDSLPEASGTECDHFGVSALDLLVSGNFSSSGNDTDIDGENGTDIYPTEIVTELCTLEADGNYTCVNDTEAAGVCTGLKPRRYDIEDLGSDCLFRGWADVQAQGAANDYCRVVKQSGPQFLSCALAGDVDDHVYTSPNASIDWFDAGHSDTWYMKDEDGDGRDDYCRCVGAPPDTIISCMKADKDGFIGFDDFQIDGSTECQYNKVNPFFGAP